jgi:hypothetical protein
MHGQRYVGVLAPQLQMRAVPIRSGVAHRAPTFRAPVAEERLALWIPGLVHHIMTATAKNEADDSDVKMVEHVKRPALFGREMVADRRMDRAQTRSCADVFPFPLPLNDSSLFSLLLEFRDQPAGRILIRFAISSWPGSGRTTRKSRHFWNLSLRWAATPLLTVLLLSEHHSRIAHPRALSVHEIVLFLGISRLAVL